MYAALLPFNDNITVDQSLIMLKNCFFSSGLPSSVNYEEVLDHTVRGSLIFCDMDGFEYVSGFLRTETWEYDNLKEITAYSAFKNEQFINIEISAQLLLAWKIWQSESQLELADIRNELEKMLLHGESNTLSLGLPYFVTDLNFPQAHSLSILDSTCYLLYYYWQFNPFSPAMNCANNLSENSSLIAGGLR